VQLGERADESPFLNNPITKPSKAEPMTTKPLSVCLLTLSTVLSPVFVTEARANAQNNWPQWRGPLANGVAPTANPPLEWSETKNVKWKIKVPGKGTATPIVWNDKIFVLTAIAPEKKAEPAPPAAPPAAANAAGGPGGEGGRRRGGGGFGRGEKPTDVHEFVVMCLDRKTGKTIWQKTAKQEIPHEGHHQDHGFASASPVTDGEVLLAYFGSRGLHCYDMEGNLKWSKDFGDMITRNGFGEGASPALFKDTVIVNWDDETEGDFIVALDKRTGKELWKNARSEPTGWATPFVVEHGGKPQVIVSGTSKIRSYDLATGKELWSCGGLGSNPIPTPVVDGDTVYVMSGHREPKLLAIALGRTGDLTDTDAVKWSYNKSTPYVPSPVLVGDSLYFISQNSGKLSCFDAKTGKPRFEAEQLEGIFGTYASLVAAKDRIYVLGREGKCVVLKPGAKVEVLASNKLDDRTDASVAMVDKELFIRGKENLYCIAEP
jgi:outer membrane protein assembly factor BamB